ncbi:hypothetical protein HYV57_02880 [Candidatus Peregrinibacteria bacterium]|nr:hypothetical protein [Candidatus Peregrinibacteria bacterium]
MSLPLQVNPISSSTVLSNSKNGILSKNSLQGNDFLNQSGANVGSNVGANEFVSQYVWIASHKSVGYFLSAVIAITLVALSLSFWQQERARQDFQVFALTGDATITQNAIFRDMLKNSAKPLTNFQQLRQDAQIVTGPVSKLSMIFSEKSMIRFDINTAVVIKVPPFDFDLISGRVWIDNTLGGEPVILKIGRHLVRLENAAVSVERVSNTESFQVYVDRHSALVELSLDQSSMKPILVPDHTKFLFDPDHLSEKFENIRYSKLQKEFLKRLDTAVIDTDEWIQENRRETSTLTKNFQQRFFSILSSRSEAVSSDNIRSGLENAYYAFGFYFTISQQKRDQLFLSHIFDALYSAEYLLSEGKRDEGLQKLVFLEQAVTSLRQEKSEHFTRIRDVLLKIFFEEVQNLRSILPTDPLYEAKDALRRMILSLLDETKVQEQTLFFLQDRLYEVYDALLSGQRAEAKSAFLIYKTQLHKVLNVGQSDVLSLLNDHYYLVFHLFLEHDDFLDRNYFDVFEKLEDRILELTSQEEHYENRLTFVSNTLRILKKISYLMRQNVLPVESGLDLGNMLISRSEKLRISKGNYDVAVDKVFEEDIRNYKELFAFFASSDFQAVGLYSDETFAAYKKMQADREELKRYVDSLSKTTQKRVKRNAATLSVSEVEKLFSDRDIQVSNIEPVEENDSRLYSIGKGTFNGVDFQVKYDTQTTLVYDMVIRGKPYTYSVFLDGFSSFIQFIQKEEKKKTSRISQISPPVLTTIEKEYIILLVREFSEKNIEISSENAQILDFEKKRFFISKAALANDRQIIFSFEFDFDKKIASRLTLEMSFGKREITGVLGLNDIEKTVLETYEKAKTEYEHILNP